MTFDGRSARMGWSARRPSGEFLNFFIPKNPKKSGIGHNRLKYRENGTLCRNLAPFQLRLSERTLGNGWPGHAELCQVVCLPHDANTDALRPGRADFRLIFIMGHNSYRRRQEIRITPTPIKPRMTQRLCQVLQYRSHEQKGIGTDGVTVGEKHDCSGTPGRNDEVILQEVERQQSTGESYSITCVGTSYTSTTPERQDTERPGREERHATP